MLFVGVFKTKFWIANLSGEKQVELEGYVDVGATYSVVPENILESLGIERKRKIAIKGICCKNVVDVGDALFRICVDDEIIEGISSVVFGDDPELILLGAHALEALGLEVDLVNKRLKKAVYVAMF